MDIMEFKTLYAIYKENLPSMEVFFYDGKHAITPKAVAKHYGARRVHTVWGTFVADYIAFAKAQVKKPAPKKPVPKKPVTAISDKES